MFEKIKNLFSEDQEKQEKVKVKINLQEVEDWIQSEKKDFFKDLESQIQQNYSSFDKNLQTLKEKFSDFQKASIDPEVVKMIKKAAQTNKKIIEKNLQNFMDSISIPKSTDYDTAYSFCKDTSSRLEKFVQKSEKGLGILSRVLKDETKGLKTGLTGLEETLSNFMVYLNQNQDAIKKIRQSKELSEKIQNQIQKKIKLKKELKEKKKKLKSEKQSKSTFKKEIKRIEQSKEMSDFKELQDKKKKAKKKIDNLKEKKLQEISYLEKAFKKLSYQKSGKKAEKIKKHLNNPKSLEKQDSQNLKKLTDFLEENLDDLDLSKKRKKKALKGIKRIRSGVLDDILDEYQKTKENLSELKSKINSSPVLEKKNKKQYQYNEKKRQIKELQKKIKDLESKMQEINPKQKIQELQNKLEDLTKKEVKIVVS